MLKTENVFFALKIEGLFKYIKLRSVPKQEEPYKHITNVAKEMTYFEAENIYGSLFGFKSPPYIKGINVPGYHFHFVNKTLTYGGHMLDFNLSDCTIDIDIKHKFQIILSKNKEFYSLDLKNDLNDLLLKIEK